MQYHHSYNIGIVGAIRFSLMPRAGAFSANFTPEALDAFRDLCSKQGKQYTKVLQLLAELYVSTDGEVLNQSVSDPVAPSKSPSGASALKQLKQEVQRVEKDLIHADDHLETLIEDLTKRLDHLEKAFQYRSSKSK